MSGINDNGPRLVSVLDFSVPVSQGVGSTVFMLEGIISRIRIIPPGPGAYKCRIDDEIDSILTVPGDGSSMDGATSVQIDHGEVFGPTKFFITDTAITGFFKFRCWGRFGQTSASSGGT